MSVDEAELLRLRSGVPRRRLTIGLWTVEQRGDELADIAYADTVLFRAVRPVVRDQDWNTVPAVVTGSEVRADGYTAELIFRDDTVAFTGTLEVRISDAELTVEFAATATRESLCNRVGLVVLHPPEHSGSAVTVLHSSGSEDGVWPVDISPHQPFVDVTGFRWVRDPISVELALAGDVFETEDQRNWTDASFKTYSTPLDRPFPVRHQPGGSVRQSARLGVTSTTNRESVTAPPADPNLVIIDGDIAGHMPPLSTLAALFPAPELPVGPTFGALESVVVELVGDDSRWPELLELAAAQAQDLGCGLDVRIVTDQPATIDRVIAWLPSGVLRLAAFDPAEHITTAALWQALVAARASFSSPIELVAGTRAHFTELNRRFADLPSDAAALTFSLTPQMHATEVDHILDSLAMQRVVAQNALRLAGGRDVHIGPITLARRFNAVATSGPRTPEADAEAAVDPLLHTGFAAAWTLGSVAALSIPGVVGLSYFETAGPRGLALDSALTPVGQLVDRLGLLRGQPIRRTRAARDLATLAVVSTAGEVTTLVGNLSGSSRTVRVRDAGSEDTMITLGPWEVREVALSA